VVRIKTFQGCLVAFVQEGWAVVLATLLCGGLEPLNSNSSTCIELDKRDAYDPEWRSK
jgi:hypothetical protein